MSWTCSVRFRLGALELDVEVEGAEAPVALVGPNGSGKTTLLRLIAGAYRPDQGSVKVDSRTLFDSSRGVDLAPEARRVGYVPQGFGLFPHLRVVDNVAFGLATVGKLAKEERRISSTRLLEDLGIRHLAGRFPKDLSGGEQQRVALARALMVDPAILLLDEPLSALDAQSRRRLRRFLGERLRARGKPALVATHDLRDVLALGATVCVLEEGRIVQRGSVQDLRASPATDFVAEFLGVEDAEAMPVAQGRQ